MEALEDFNFDYGKPHCPKCGQEVSIDDLGQYEFYCDQCNSGFRAEDVYPNKPISFHYDRDGYFLINHLDKHILVLRSNFYTFAQLYGSPVVGAGNLESPVAEGVKTYCLGHEWFEGGIAPYPVYQVADDGQIVAAKVEIVRDSGRQHRDSIT